MCSGPDKNYFLFFGISYLFTMVSTIIFKSDFRLQFFFRLVLLLFFLSLRDSFNIFFSLSTLSCYDYLSLVLPAICFTMNRAVDLYLWAFPAMLSEFFWIFDCVTMVF